MPAYKLQRFSSFLSFYKRYNFRMMASILPFHSPVLPFSLIFFGSSKNFIAKETKCLCNTEPLRVIL